MPLAIREHVCNACRLPRSDGVLMARAEFLSQADRDLVEAVLVEGQLVKSVARMKGMTPRSVALRIHRLARLLVSKEFIEVIRSVAYLDPDDAHIARQWFCQQVPQRRLAAEIGLSVHGLRRRLDQVRARIEVIAGQRRHGATDGADNGSTEEAVEVSAGE